MQRVLRVVLPATIRPDLDQALQANLANANGHAARFNWSAIRTQLVVVTFDSRVTADAFFAGVRSRSKHHFLVRATFDVFAVAATTFLVDEHDAIFRAFVDCLTRARSQAAGIRAMVADSGEVKEPDTMLGQH